MPTYRTSDIQFVILDDSRNLLASLRISLKPQSNGEQILKMKGTAVKNGVASIGQLRDIRSGGVLKLDGIRDDIPIGDDCDMSFNKYNIVAEGLITITVRIIPKTSTS